MDYLAAAQKRVDDRFEHSVEAVRIGTVIASNAKAMQRWESNKRSRSSKPSRGLVGAALETAVMGIAQMFPGNVIHQAAA